MTSNGSPIRPPRATAWLVELFTSAEEADGVLGDLAEEFSASVARDGRSEARRRYRRQAWRTIKDLVLSPLWAQLSPSAGTTASGLLLTAGVGLAGFVMTWPIGMATNAMARAIVTRFPTADFISDSVFWSGVDLLGLLITGVLVALVAPVVRLRPMSAALAIVAVMALVFAVDRPIMMWLFGPPLGAHITFVSSALRWVRGISMFGGAILIGTAIGRMSASRHIPLRVRPSAE
jgi:hypothetical protein